MKKQIELKSQLLGDKRGEERQVKILNGIKEKKKQKFDDVPKKSMSKDS